MEKQKKRMIMVDDARWKKIGKVAKSFKEPKSISQVFREVIDMLKI